jgi:hypothetical protein
VYSFLAVHPLQTSRTIKGKMKISPPGAPVLASKVFSPSMQSMTVMYAVKTRRPSLIPTVIALAVFLRLRFLWFFITPPPYNFFLRTTWCLVLL